MNANYFTAREKFVHEWFNFNSKLFFLVLCVLSIIIYILRRAFLIDEMAAFEVLEERGELAIFNLIVTLQYASVPVVYLWAPLKTAFVC